ncbi:TerD family protein [Streptomyces acidiscabies]|uniref:TerD family protein n=1 Tax=Streptomyces acidiscabies TaxID=42234 RepID=A0AAP6BEB4_9ACTN|nr:TerD family protein [Streptomyces acidiscabies]MBP5939586.1 TerD family protein [Streptomyces sp. LBUM 1476]MBZ3910748.1 TerD family protein [Streptomyces acidiscabies]MDX2963070.1 TerD family protein [Streptomyces acidiscabies]MDX3017384.1 TerD family protein [Streptomyces acidiscabies]MDX3787860.1 TerD family protein [Streptomyces acidiscabies]
MKEMTKGSNVALAALSESAGSVIVSLSWVSPTGEGDADVSVLLLDENGKVRSDGDFYFYNNPVAADGSVQMLGKTPTDSGDEDRISFDLTVVPPEVERIVVAASRYGAAGFGELEDLKVTLADGSGEALVGFAIEDAGAVSAIIFGELYRRGEEWKFRAVGQGYDAGLAGLATDFGVDIEDDAGAEEPPDQQEFQPETLLETPPKTLQGPPHETALALVPTPRAPAEEEAAPKKPARPRTAKKKVTVPKTPKKSLAENESWRQSRLFPASALKSDHDRETRATSVLLSVMAQVPEFGRRLTAAFGAPAGRMETFTEVSLPHGDTPKRPDGVIRVERAGKLWTALVETKTNGNALKSEQVQAYMDIAARRGYEAVITLSNDVALEGSPLVDVKVDGRRKHKVGLWHLSWAEVAYQAQMLIRHEGVNDKAHAWLLLELLHYLRHENSGCHGFQNMGAAWVPVRNGIDDETLCAGDPRALDVVESWERLVRQLCLSLGGELGQKVLPVQRAKRGADPKERRSRLADQLCVDGRLLAELRIEGAPGILAVGADLRTARLRTSIDIPAPDQGYPLTWAKRLIRHLSEAPADLHVETLVEDGTGPRGTLERLRPEPADLLPKNPDTRITGFRLSLLKSMGSSRGNAESGFIRSVDDAVNRFHTGVVVHLDRA